MIMNYENMEIQRKQQRICDLKAMLSCTSSSIGDWKIAKCMEYQAIGLDLPYDIDKLYADRQAVRDEINQIQAELDEMMNV